MMRLCSRLRRLSRLELLVAYATALLLLFSLKLTPNDDSNGDYNDEDHLQSNSQCDPFFFCFSERLKASFFEPSTGALRCTEYDDSSFLLFVTQNATQRRFQPLLEPRDDLPHAHNRRLANKLCDYVEPLPKPPKPPLLFTTIDDANRFLNDSRDDLYARDCIDEEQRRMIMNLVVDVGVSKSSERGTCAVVGNSYILRNSDYGIAIDNHTHVYRINWAPLEGHEADVGRRTTHMLVNRRAASCNRHLEHHLDSQLYATSYSCSNQSHYVNERILVISKSRLCYQFLSFLRANNALQLAPRHRLLLLSAQFEYLLKRLIIEQKSPSNAAMIDLLLDPLEVEERVDRRRRLLYKVEPSTGFFAVLLALFQCESVDLYGFGHYEPFIHNYWTAPRVAKEGFKHEYREEQRLYKQLARGRMPPLLRSYASTLATKLTSHGSIDEWKPPPCERNEGCRCSSDEGDDACTTGLACISRLLCVNLTADQTQAQIKQINNRLQY